MKKYLHKINETIILRPLSFVQNYTKQKNLKNTFDSIVNGHIIMKVCIGVAHDKTIPHTE